MPITIKQNELKFKDKDSGQYTSIDVVSDGTTAERVAAIQSAAATQISAVQSAGATQIAAVQTKGEQTIATIPSDYTALSNEVSDISETTENIFDMSVFDGVDGISKDANGYYTGTGEAFKTAFSSGVPGLTFEANAQYFLSVVAYTDGDISTAATNGLQFNFYTSDNTRIGRGSVLNSQTTAGLLTLFSTSGNSVSYMTISASNSILNTWHIKDVMLCKSSVAVDYVQHITAYDIVARTMADRSVYETDISGEKVSGSYINLQNKNVGDTVSLTPTANNSMSYVLHDCSEGDCFLITASGLSAAKTYAFIDSNGVITEVWNSSEFTITNYPVIAPTAGKLIVNSVNAQPFALKMYVNAKIVEYINAAQFLNAENATHRWKGKKIVAFGDSRTWYDGHLYTENTKSELRGSVCFGYQEQIRNLLMAEVVNQGASGETSAEICTRVRAFDFTGYDAVLLEGGVNDFVKSSTVTIGEIAPIGSTFDTTTVYGAWQSAIEYIATNYPLVKIYMDIPAIAWLGANDDVFPYNTAKIKGEIAELYSLPCKDLYKTSGINKINRDAFYCDDTSLTNNWHLHFNDDGNALIGAELAMFINDN